MRQSLSAHGVDGQLTFVHDLSKSPFDNPGNEAGFDRYSLDLSATLDGAKLLGWKGTSAFVRFKHHEMQFGQCYDGVAQTYSNIDAPSHTGLYEMWGQQSLLSDRVRIKAGRIDANSDYAVVSSAADFLNSSMGFSPTIMELPTYPNPQAGVSLAVAPSRSSQVQFGVFQTSGGGKIALLEGAQNWTLKGHSLPGRTSVGYWSLRKEMTHFDGTESHGTQGFYTIAEQTWWHRKLSGEKDNEQRVSTFVQLGTGQGSENPYLYHLGLGATVNAPFRARPNDAVGIALTRVRFTDDPMAGSDRTAESVIESYYRSRITSHLSLVSDIQFFENTGGAGTHPDYLVATPRLVVTF